ncbi:MAG TPA: FecR domain-containing protein [Chitinophagaceae bacterium]|nr:FecR domain-containing protein [Chitinophagaceae bacterium]
MLSILDNNDCCLENPTHIWYIIARKLNGEASPQEEQELIDLLRQDEELQQQYDVLVRIWKEKHGEIKDEDNINARNTISRIINRASSENNDNDIEVAPFRNRRRFSRRISLVISSVVIILVIGLFLLKETKPVVIADKKTEQDPIVANNGSRSRSLLPDGTTVWLNAGSRLHYENDFNGATREVRLEGEAFFDVIKQPERPFIVHTSGIDIKVLGTAFNVKSYPEDKTVETTLYRGLVQVSRQEDITKKVIQLRPNEKLILPKQAAKEEPELSEEKTPITKQLPPNFVITHIDSTKKESERFETAWIYSRLEFRGNGFEELAHKLERWYNVTIVFADEKVKNLNFNGSFEKENVEQAFKALKVAVPLFNYKIENHEILVSSSK